MNEISNSTWIQIRSESDILSAMLQAELMSNSLEFKSSQTVMIKTSVSELGHNILKYAGTGKIILTPLSNKFRKGIQIDAIDKGPGINNIEVALSDHFSTGGTLGLGLPGIKRMMDEFNIESGPDKGTKVTVKKWS